MNKRKQIGISNAKPINFTTEDCQDLIAGRKTQFRKICRITINGGKIVPHENAVSVVFPDTNMYGSCASFYSKEEFFCGAAQQPFSVGDFLYVREPFGYGYYENYNGKIFFKADYEQADKPMFVRRWYPAQYMQEQDSRFILRVTDVRLEKLQEISFDSCKAEGIWDNYRTYSDEYHELLANFAYPKVFASNWNARLSKKAKTEYSWEKNPWVYVISFELVENKSR